MSKTTKVVLGIVAAAALAGGSYWKYGRGQEAEALATRPKPVPVERGELRSTVQCTGRIVPNLTVEIKCKAGGQIIALPFDVSDTVKQGDLLAELDPVEQGRNVTKAEATVRATEARLAQARANLASAETSLSVARARSAANVSSATAQLSEARARVERERSLLERKHASVEEWQSAEASAVRAESDLRIAQSEVNQIAAQEAELAVRREDVLLSEIQLEKDRVDLALAQQYLSETRVLAPMDGTVSSRSVQIGQIIASGISNVGGGTPIMVLSDLSRLFILASVDESEIGRVTLGQPVEITVDAFPDRTFTGEVVRIATDGVNVSNVITFEVKIEIKDESRSLLKPEMTANVEIVAAAKESVIQVPLAAVSRTPDGAFVEVAGTLPGESTRTAVKLGITDGLNVEIVDGLKEGDLIVPRAARTAPQEGPRRGMGPRLF